MSPYTFRRSARTAWEGLCILAFLFYLAAAASEEAGAILCNLLSTWTQH